MDISRQQILLYIIFTLCIIFIVVYYYKYINTINYINNKNNIIENFYNSNGNGNGNGNYLSAFNNSEIPNVSARNALNTQLESVNTIFDKYGILDSSITVNNNGVICDSWDNYSVNANTSNTMNIPNTPNSLNATASNPYDSSLNSCKPVQGSNTSDEQCLSNNMLTSCSNYFTDGKLNKLITIDLKTLKNNTRDRIIRNIGQLFSTLDTQSNKIDSVLNTLLDKLKLE